MVGAESSGRLLGLSPGSDLPSKAMLWLTGPPSGWEWVELGLGTGTTKHLEQRCSVIEVIASLEVF